MPSHTDARPGYAPPPREALRRGSPKAAAPGSAAAEGGEASARSRHCSPPKHVASGGGLRVRTMAALLTAALSLAAAPIQRESVPPKGQSPGPAEIARAIDAVKADPNLATERTIKLLRWRGSTEAKPPGSPAWLAWIAGLFLWLEQSARLLVWCAAVVLAGVLVVYIIRVVRVRGGPRRDESFVAPTHVQDLDIRPETLPQDVGAAARVLWDRGEHRASLALLYRGLLSRLAHVHRVPIRDSSTEGDCLALSAATHLTPGKHEYASRLVRVWQRAVYGREDVQTAIVHVLCDDFASALDPASPLDSIAPGGAA